MHFVFHHGERAQYARLCTYIAHYRVYSIAICACEYILHTYLRVYKSNGPWKMHMAHTMPAICLYMCVEAMATFVYHLYIARLLVCMQFHMAMHSNVFNFDANMIRTFLYIFVYFKRWANWLDLSVYCTLLAAGRCSGGPLNEYLFTLRTNANTAAL